MKYIELNFKSHGPDSTPAKYLASIQEVVRKHFAKCQGHCLLYGPILGYRYVVSETESILLSTAGEIVKSQRGRFWPHSITMAVED